jgi:major membrane immunogen (membrane-anchored lipoprotein)
MVISVTIVTLKVEDFFEKDFYLFFLVIAALSLNAQVSLGSVKDGYYFAQENAFASDGWKSQAVLKVSGGKIVEATWNGVSNAAYARDKMSQAAAGRYGMVKASKIKAEWDARPRPRPPT